MRAIVYLRVSTIHQKESRSGLKLQLNRCKQIAARMHVKERHVFEDAATSGFVAIEQRSGLTAALQMLESGDIFLVSSRDRLARDALIVMQIERVIEQCGATFICAENNVLLQSHSLFNRRKLDIKAELVRERIKEATLKSINKKRKLSYRYGTIPYGYKINRSGNLIIECRKEQAILKHVQRLHENGYSLRDIVRDLGKQGYCSRTKKPFQLTQIVNMLKDYKKQQSAVKIDRSAPYGFKKLPDGTSETNPNEQVVVDLVQQLHLEKHSLRAIAYVLNSKKYRNRAGNKFHATQVVRIIERLNI